MSQELTALPGLSSATLRDQGLTNVCCCPCAAPVVSEDDSLSSLPTVDVKTDLTLGVHLSSNALQIQ